jgi:hypothetical protein
MGIKICNDYAIFFRDREPAGRAIGEDGEIVRKLENSDPFVLLDGRKGVTSPLHPARNRVNICLHRCGYNFGVSH